MTIKIASMKSLAIVCSAALLSLFSLAFVPTDKGEVNLTCNVNTCEKVDSIFLFEFNGIVFKPVKVAKTTDWTTYKFNMPATTPR